MRTLAIFLCSPYLYIVLTKVDADVKGGTAISLAYAIGNPILYVGVGQ
ncbi:MAG TPA: hypothetical protein EYP82_04355, partial [Hydrogenothermaceae bacterium]|nr:hypothetical protein [Hydrogenothermaceae bacterium]